MSAALLILVVFLIGWILAGAVTLRFFLAWYDQIELLNPERKPAKKSKPKKLPSKRWPFQVFRYEGGRDEDSGS